MQGAGDAKLGSMRLTYDASNGRSMAVILPEGLCCTESVSDSKGQRGKVND